MKRAWIFFWILTVIWGSSFLFMRIIVEQMPPAQVAFTRIAIATVCMNVTLLLTGRRYPRDRKTLLALLLLGWSTPACRSRCWHGVNSPVK
ncbi:MAG: EamA family transporter [Anaerolineae bacterium]